MKITQVKFGLPIQKYYFEEPSICTSWFDYLLPTAYLDCYTPQKPQGFIREDRHTLLTDLRPSSKEIFNNFQRDTRRQIRHTQDNNIFYFNTKTDLQTFIQLFNAFAQPRGLSLITQQDSQLLASANYRIFSMDWQGQPLICHFYLLCAEKGIVNILISAASQAYAGDQEMRRQIGQANRYLHWQCMLHFKAAGFHTYDWGGYVAETTDPVMQGINRFKRTFNGTLTPIYNHYSPTYALIEKVRLYLKK